jgi:hypothetical protein
MPVLASCFWIVSLRLPFDVFLKTGFMKQWSSLRLDLRIYFMCSDKSNTFFSLIRIIILTLLLL